MQRSQIDHGKPSVGELFNNRVYHVPKYQRAFAWKEENAEKFWSDIFESESTDDYFLGSILLSKVNGEMEELEIIDGQQRITTCSLFFLAFYLVYRDNVDPNDAITDIYAYLKGGRFDEKYDILTLSRINCDFYKELIRVSSFANLSSLNAGEEKSNKNMRDIVSFFYSSIKKGQKKDSNEEKVRLQKMFKKFIGKVFFLEIVVPDSRKASTLFEVLNHRGTDLTEADLVRNYIFSKLESRGEDGEKFFRKWEEIEKRVELNNLEQFLRYSSFLLKKEEGGLEEKNLYGRIERYTITNSPVTVIEFLYELSDFYARILNPDSDGCDDDVESELLNELDILNVTQARSIILAAYKKYSREDRNNLIRFIISFTLRYSISGKNPNKLEKRYAELAYQIYNEGLTLKEVKGVISPLVSEEEFELNFPNNEFKKTELPRYILSKMENYLSSGEKKVDPKSVHLEHIMPKKIEKWGSENPVYYEIWGKYINTIGNMIILLDNINIRIKNGIFSKKKEKYEESDIGLLLDIKSKESWGEEEIKENAQRYLKLFKEIWPI